MAARAPLSHRLVTYLQDVTTILSWQAARAFGVTLLLTLTEGVGLFMRLPLLQMTGLELGPGPASQAANVITRSFVALHLPMSLSAVLFIYMLTVSVSSLLSRFETVNTFALQQHLVAYLRRRLYEAITRADWLFFVRSRSSDFMHTLTRELETVEVATSTLFSWFVNLMVTGVYIAFALWLYPLMTCVVLASGSVLLLLRFKVNRAQEQGEALSKAYEALYADMSDHFAGMKTAKATAWRPRTSSSFYIPPARSSAPTSGSSKPTLRSLPGLK